MWTTILAFEIIAVICVLAWWKPKEERLPWEYRFSIWCFGMINIIWLIIALFSWFFQDCTGVCKDFSWDKYSACINSCEKTWRYIFKKWVRSDGYDENKLEEAYERSLIKSQEEDARYGKCRYQWNCDDYIKYDWWNNCTIKWNVSFDSWKKIYHVPWCSHYNDTKIDPDYGERYFCSEEEAINAWWRKCIDY